MPVLAYTSPLLLGLVVLSALALSSSPNKNLWHLVKQFALCVTVPVIIISALLVLLQLIFPHKTLALNAIGIMKLTAFLWTWALMAGGIYSLMVAIGLGKHLSLVIVFLLILLMNTTVFYINPFISSVQDNPALRQSVIKIAVSGNPMLTIAGSLFHHDLLRARLMYSICDIGPYYFYSYGHWATTAFYCGLIGILTSGFSLWLTSRAKRDK